MKFDVTISICSYKRTHNLEKIIDALWNKQNLNISFEIILWNNNEQREYSVKQLCRKYLEDPRCDRRLELIQSTKNYYCSIRLAISQLMRSNCLIICDDDVIPGQNFIKFFIDAHKLHRKDLLCVRGHKFLEHTFDHNNPSKVWYEYQNLRFVKESDPEQFVHFMHAHACLIPRDALLEVSSKKVIDSSFILVDDYWLSFVASKYFGRKIRKLYLENSPNVILYTNDSEKEQLALYTREEVKHAKVKLYIHHMLNKWPEWNVGENLLLNEKSCCDEVERVKVLKLEFWKSPCFGVNISAYISDEDIAHLRNIKVSAIRIGAADDSDENFALKDLLEDTENAIYKINDLIKKINLKTIISLNPKIASPEIWKCIAEEFKKNELVVGYDLINEPFLESDDRIHWMASSNKESEIAPLIKKYQEIIIAIREIDQITPIIVEPNYWGRYYALENFSSFLTELKKYEKNIIVSVHFFEPHLLTNRQLNKNRFSYPGPIPIYKCATLKYSETETDLWNKEKIKEIFEMVF